MLIPQKTSQLRWLHIDFNDIFIEYGQSLEVWFCCKFQCFHAVFDLSYIHVILDVFHRLSKDRDVHRLEDIVFEVIFFIRAQLRVELGVTFYPRFFFENYSSVNLFYLQTAIRTFFAVLMVNDIPLFVVEILIQLLYPIDKKPIMSK